MTDDIKEISPDAYHLPAGAVSFGLLWDIRLYVETLFLKLHYLVDTVPDDEFNEGHAFIGDLACVAESCLNSLFEKAEEGKLALGDNDVYVVKRVP